MADRERRLEGRDVKVEWRGDDATFNVQDIQLSESLSSIYSLSTTIFTNNRDITSNDLLGTRLRFVFKGSDRDRVFSGICVDASRAGSSKESNQFAIRIGPWAWTLGQNVDTRIFQNLNCIDIIKAIFSEYVSAKFEDKTTGYFKEITYIVQYDETDLNFLNRLLEEYGVYFFFRHDPDGEVLVLCNGRGGHKSVPDHAEIPFFDPDRNFKRYTEHVSFIDAANYVVPNEVTKKDNDFTKIQADLKVTRKVPEVPKPIDKMKVYIPQAGHMEVDEGDNKAKLTVEAIHAGQHIVSGACNVRNMAVGFKFSLTGHETAEYNQEYLVVAAHHSIVGEHDFGGGGHGGDDYTCHFEAIPTDRPYRPKRLTPKPRINSIQTAVVTGPEAEEIYTDEYGRVKLQFHWDRLGKMDESSSRWVRVATPWAGQNWGALTIPRIGQEVVVQFENGDPDRPIVTGMLFNAENMPPYELPGAATQSGFKSNSSKGGGGANEIQMEDKKDQEKFSIVAERDMSMSVKNDMHVKVGYDKSAPGSYNLEVHQDRVETVSNGSYELGVDKGSRTVFVKAADGLTVKGSRTETISGQKTETIANAKTVTAKSVEITAEETITISAGTSITLSVGGNTIVISEAGVDVDGKMIYLN